MKMIHFLAPVCHVTLYAFTAQACALQMLLTFYAGRFQYKDIFKPVFPVLTFSVEEEMMIFIFWANRSFKDCAFNNGYLWRCKIRESIKSNTSQNDRESTS